MGFHTRSTGCSPKMPCDVTYWCVVCFVASHLLRTDVIARDPKATVVMDLAEGCGKEIMDDRLSEGDLYKVNSETHTQEGLAYWKHKENILDCRISFDFGGRLIAVIVDMWQCDDKMEGNDAYLAIYGDCAHEKHTLLKWMNGSVIDQSHSVSIYSPGSCVSLYFYRGQERSGCQFELTILARYEKVPAFKIAAVIISSIVILMLVVKFFCVVTGYERRLPDISFDPEEQKHILNETSTADPVIEVEEAHDTFQDGPADHSAMTSKNHRKLTVSTDQSHRTLGVTRSSGSARSSHGSTSADVSSELDFDFLDLPSTPRLKRYPSAKASSIWRHK